MEWLESLQSHEPSTLQERIVGEAGAVESWWRGFANNPVKRAALGDKVDPQNTFVFGMRGDGAPTTETIGLFTLAWNASGDQGSTRNTRQMFTAMPKSAWADGTLLACFDYLAWAMNALLEGTIPERGHRGNPHPQALAKSRVAMMHLRGDWEFYDQVLHFPRWGGVPRMCWLRRAEQGNGVEAVDALNGEGACVEGHACVRRGVLGQPGSAGRARISKPIAIIALRLDGGDD